MRKQKPFVLKYNIPAGAELLLDSQSNRIYAYMVHKPERNGKPGGTTLVFVSDYGLPADDQAEGSIF